jgi:hypothetical protein
MWGGCAKGAISEETLFSMALLGTDRKFVAL